MTTAIDPDLLVVFTNSEIGQGPSDLGERLAGLWLGCMAKEGRRPARMIFLNSGIFLTTEGSPVLDALREIEAGGTEIVSCITCLTYHDRMERVAVGTAGDMKGTCADMFRFPKVVTL